MDRSISPDSINLTYAKTEPVTKSFTILAAFFVFGAIVGVSAGRFLSSDATHELDASLNNFIAYINDDYSKNTSFFSALINAVKFPALALFLGSSLLGIVLLPPLVCVRGFYLGYAVTAMSKILGPDKYTLILAIYCPGSFISVPALFIIATISMHISKFIVSRIMYDARDYRLLTRRTLQTLAICMVATVLSALSDAYLTPFLAGFCV